MEFTTDYKDKADAIIAMFTETFTSSEGAEAAQKVRTLVTEMLATLGPDEMSVFSATQDGAVVASIIFTRLTYAHDQRAMFILAPVAVATGQQGKGVGQRLISYGLQILRDRSVDVALTYGDINFYAKVGFHHISEADAAAPLPLQYPEGWLGQSLTQAEFEPLAGSATCVAPLNDPDHW